MATLQERSDRTAGLGGFLLGHAFSTSRRFLNFGPCILEVNVRCLRIVFSNGSRGERLFGVSTLSGACVLCVLVRHLMG